MDKITRLTVVGSLLLALIASSCDATLFKYKYEKKQELLDHFKGKQPSLSHGYDQQPQFGTTGTYFAIPTGYEHFFGGTSPFAFKHAYPVAYPVPKLVSIPHPVPVPVERPIAIPVPIHFGKALGDYASSAYESALANYASLTQHANQQHHRFQSARHNHYQHQQSQGHYGGYSAPVYEQDCYPYCDINLPQGSSPVPLISKEKRMQAKKEKKVAKADMDNVQIATEE